MQKFITDVLTFNSKQLTVTDGVDEQTGRPILAICVHVNNGEFGDVVEPKDIGAPVFGLIFPGKEDYEAFVDVMNQFREYYK